MSPQKDSPKGKNKGTKKKILAREGRLMGGSLRVSENLGNLVLLGRKLKTAV